MSMFQRLFFGRPEEIKQAQTEIQIAVFPFGEHPELHWIMRGEDPWFLADIVCQSLAIGNTSQAVSSLDADERDGIILNDTAGRPNKKLIVNESGLYSLILNSRKPEAKNFRKWVTSEVLPSIRKTGSYTLPTAREVKWAKRIKGNAFSGKLRTKIADVHIKDLNRVFEEGGGISEFAEGCNAFWAAMGFPNGSQDARKALGLSIKNGRPWNYMSDLAMAVGLLAKSSVERKIRDNEKEGKIVLLEDRPNLIYETAKQYHNDVARQHNGKMGVIKDQRRGHILDIVAQGNVS